MTWSTFLRLGRVSNLPTVWTNVVAGMVLAGATASVAAFMALAIAVSALYVAGMILNDVYDAELDARERPERPIPRGEVSLKLARRWGFGLLFAGVGLVSVAGMTLASPPRPWPGLAAAVTAAFIVLYDRHHKGRAIAPVIMGLCRVGVYSLGAAWLAPDWGSKVWVGAASLGVYVVGLTYVASFENRREVAQMWPLGLLLAPGLWALWHGRHEPLALFIMVGFGLWVARAIALARRGQPEHTRDAVVSLIAGIALLDAGVLAGCGTTVASLFAFGAFGLTLVLQRRVAGT